ncbi:unnamed protein product [Acanthosepion pharaonis]|uniref:Uncharacterized protein n=1 Tax=Acanthosepion pharaonis TaxID=158019 RepID=A0A812DAC7_ACAPH|nr:unnamed protein product [Sepia pharaonis]
MVKSTHKAPFLQRIGLSSPTFPLQRIGLSRSDQNRQKAPSSEDWAVVRPKSPEGTFLSRGLSCHGSEGTFPPEDWAVTSPTKIVRRHLSSRGLGSHVSDQKSFRRHLFQRIGLSRDQNRQKAPFLSEDWAVTSPTKIVRRHLSPEDWAVTSPTKNRQKAPFLPEIGLSRLRPKSSEGTFPLQRIELSRLRPKSSEGTFPLQRIGLSLPDQNRQKAPFLSRGLGCHVSDQNRQKAPFLSRGLGCHVSDQNRQKAPFLSRGLGCHVSDQNRQKAPFLSRGLGCHVSDQRVAIHERKLQRKLIQSNLFIDNDFIKQAMFSLCVSEQDIVAPDSFNIRQYGELFFFIFFVSPDKRPVHAEAACLSFCRDSQKLLNVIKYANNHCHRLL